MLYNIRMNSIIFILIVFFLFPIKVFPEQLIHNVFGDNGTKITATNIILNYTSGEEFIYTVQNEFYTMKCGFWYTLKTGTATIQDTIPPTAPILLSPSNNSWTNNKTINFIWERSTDPIYGTGIKGYELNISTNPNFSIILSSYFCNTNNSILTLNYQSYYWRVRAVDYSNNYSQWSSIWKITISSRTWIITLESDKTILLADNSDNAIVTAKFIEPAGGGIVISTFNYPISFNLYCGQTLRDSFIITASSGIASFNYKDNIAGQMTIEASFMDYTSSLLFTNIINSTVTTTVWCSDDGGKTQLICESGTFSKNTEIKITKLSTVNYPENTDANYLPDTFREFKAYQDGIELIDKSEFKKSLTLVFAYTEQDSKIEGVTISEDKLLIYKLENNKVYMTNCSVDKTNNKVTAIVDSLSVFFLGWAEPKSLKLYQNYPNPFKLGTRTNIVFEIDTPLEVSMKIYNLNGELVKTIIEKTTRDKGNYREYWDGTNNSNSEVSPGIYICQLTAGNYKSIIKIAVIKNE